MRKIDWEKCWRLSEAWFIRLNNKGKSPDWEEQKKNIENLVEAQLRKKCSLK